MTVAADDGRRRVIIENVVPAVDHGRFPIKRTVGESVTVEISAFADGHDQIVCRLCYRKDGNSKWSEVPMQALGNDRWRSSFVVEEVGGYRYTAVAWVDAFLSWQRDLTKRSGAEQDLTVPFQVGSLLVEVAAARAKGADRARLKDLAALLVDASDDAARRTAALGSELTELMERYPDRSHSTTYAMELGVVVDRERARFSAWYEFFPRSCTDDPGRHGRLKDCETRLRAAAAMGFDVVYLPPIHPIGRSYRKGKNNTEQAQDGDVGSPWAIGAKEGGHREIHPELGTIEDFRRFIEAAKKHGLEVALDIAFQCAPDHPYVESHPEWFLKRPDGSVQYAENPPKKADDFHAFT